MRRIILILLLINLFGQAIWAQASGRDLSLIRARFLVSESNFSEALKILNGDQPATESQSEWSYAKGLALLGSGNPESAISVFSTLISDKPSDAYYQLARSAVKRNDPEAAIDYLQKHLARSDHFTEKVIKQDTAFSSLEGNRSWIRLWQEDWYSSDEQTLAEAIYAISCNQNDLAVELLEKVDKNNPLFANALFRKGQLLNNQGQTRDAGQLFSEAISLSRKNLRLLDEMAGYFLANSFAKLAEQGILQQLLLDPTNPQYLLSRAMLRIESASEAVASNEIEWLSAVGISSAELFYQAGIRFIKTAPDRADLYLSKAINSEILEAKYFYARGSLRCRQNKTESGLDDLAMSLDINPNQPVLYLERGEFRYASGDEEGACYDWNRALQLGNGRAADLLARHCK